MKDGHVSVCFVSMILARICMYVAEFYEINSCEGERSVVVPLLLYDTNE